MIGLNKPSNIMACAAVPSGGIVPKMRVEAINRVLPSPV